MFKPAHTLVAHNILLFSGPAGEQYGYLDHDNPDGTFTYFGEGQRSDQTMTRGNLAILQHGENERHLRVFRSSEARMNNLLRNYN